MIEYIKGKIAEMTPTYAVIDCNGIGYMAAISLNTFEALREASECKLFVHEAIREDAYQLYGFATLAEREVFRLLTSVSGVGAGSARVILSAETPLELQTAIMGEDVNTLKGIKGIGPKTAQRIIIELKDKIGKLGISGDGVSATAASATAAAKAENAEVREEALQALEVLGYNRAAAQKAVDKLLKEDPSMKVQNIVKMAFKLM